jgi:hypothetical protein
MPPTPTPPPSPTLIGEFTSSSGRTILRYYNHRPSAVSRHAIPTPPGFEQVEVLLTGFTVATDSQEAPIRRVAAQARKVTYEVETGYLVVQVAAQIESDGQASSADVTFVVILTDADAARFTRIDTGCGGDSACHVSRRLRHAVPPGMEYIGLGVVGLGLGTADGDAIPLNTIAAQRDTLWVDPPSLDLDYAFVLSDGAGANPMFCEWAAQVVAFDPREMTQGPTYLSNQYTFAGASVAEQRFVSETPMPPNAVTGFLDALDGFQFSFFQAPGEEHPIWRVEVSAATPILGPNGVISQYGVFLGTTFGDEKKTEPYMWQLSRAAGFLHYVHCSWLPSSRSEGRELVGDPALDGLRTSPLCLEQATPHCRRRVRQPSNAYSARKASVQQTLERLNERRFKSSRAGLRGHLSNPPERLERALSKARRGITDGASPARSLA